MCSDRVKVAQEVEKGRGDIEESRREYYLRQQLKTIVRISDEDLSRRDSEDYATKLEELNFPEDISKEAAREIDRLRHIQPSSSNIRITRIWNAFSLPWGKTTDEDIGPTKVRTTLDEGHFSLDKVRNGSSSFSPSENRTGSQGAILCFAGPPGVAKQVLESPLQKPSVESFFWISVGGVRDEAEAEATDEPMSQHCQDF